MKLALQLLYLPRGKTGQRNGPHINLLFLPALSLTTVPSGDCLVAPLRRRLPVAGRLRACAPLTAVGAEGSDCLD